MADSEVKNRPSVLAKILNPEASAGPGANDARESSKDAWKAIYTPMLDVVLMDGSIESFNYAYLTRIGYRPGDTLKLYFGTDVVVVEGRNLQEDRERIRLHRADHIREGTEAEGGLKADSASHIDSIRVTDVEALEKEEKGEQEREQPWHKRSARTR